MNRISSFVVAGVVLGFGVFSTLSNSSAQNCAGEFRIKLAQWSADQNRLWVDGCGTSGSHTVVVVNAKNHEHVVGSVPVYRGGWTLRINAPASIPCSVFAEQSDGQSEEMDVKHAPKDCAGS